MGFEMDPVKFGLVMCEAAGRGRWADRSQLESTKKCDFKMIDFGAAKLNLWFLGLD